MDRLNKMEKWFLTIAGSIILASGGGQILTLVTLAEVKTELNNIKENSKDRYTGQQALAAAELQKLRDAQQDDRIGSVRDTQLDRLDRIRDLEAAVEELKREGIK